MESLREIAEAARGRMAGPGEDAGVCPAGVSIDTRTLKRGALFFAIGGPNHDGHRFVEEAFSKGAVGAVVSRADALPEGRTGIVVDDTTRALQEAAASRLRRIGARVVGITGSSGKTTTKEMTRSALSGSFRVMASRGNLNNIFGLPLTLFDLEQGDQIAVLEMGISTRGEMRRLAEIADPDLAILTNLSGAHLEFFDSLDDYAKAKAELFETMRPNTTGIFNADDERCRRIASSFHGYAATFGMDTTADFRGTEYRGLGLDGCAFTVVHSGGSRDVSLRFAGAHHAMNALAALAAGHLLGCGLDSMISGLEKLEPLEMRGRVVNLEGGVRILDDSYNANPGAVRAALAVLSQTDPRGGRRIAVLGDMLELGEDADHFHREIGRLLAATGIDAAYLVGKLSLATAAEAGRAGFAGVTHLDNAAEAAERLAREVRPGDVILVKGSRSIGLDGVVRALAGKIGESGAAGGAA
jgi:UDP-N-acetylmuramoyl-tripeptide--D-alanyl-D-alanine ligase